MTKAKDKLQTILAILQTQYLYYLNCHWTVGPGNDFYQLHLLFERLYGAVPDQVDTLAEKLVCFYGPEAVPLCDRVLSIYKHAEELKKSGPIDGAMLLEESLQAAIKDAYTSMKNEGTLTPGVDDYLLSLANEHETHIYLLSRILGNPCPPKGMKK